MATRERKSLRMMEMKKFSSLFSFKRMEGGGGGGGMMKWL